MANIIINTVCNLQCPYCFADDCKANNIGQNITLEDFKKTLDFIVRKSGEGYVGILGGEPLIHPNFDSLISEVIKDDYIGSCCIFTNGLEIDNHMGFFASDKVHTLINFNSEEIVGSKDNLNRIMGNIETLLYLKKNSTKRDGTLDGSDAVALGLNIYKPDQDFTDILTTLTKFNRHHLRISTVVPNNQDKRDLNPLEYFSSMKGALMRLFDELYKIKVVPGSDCNYIPLCIFSEEEINELNRKFMPLAEKYNDRFNITSNQYCDHGVMDFYPDKTVARCFGFSEYDRQPFEKYNNLNEIRNYFEKNIESLSFYIPSDYMCKNCHNFKTKQCSGGCLSYKTEKITKLRKMVESECDV